MRNLTIHRQKSFVASLASMKVYIEDPETGDLNINGCLCRKLGNVKNNETVTFQIPDTAARIYVIGDKLSRGFCNEFYPLEAGTEDVTLTGKCHYNPTAGNPFRFEGVTNVDVLKNRKRGARIGIVVMILAFLVGIGIGLLGNTSSPKTFQLDGFSITLTDEFEPMDAPGFDEALSTDDVGFLVIEERFSRLEGAEQLSLQEYGELVKKANNHSYELKEENGVTYYEYTAEGEDGKLFHYFVTVHKGPDAFWIVQFFTFADEANSYRDDIFQWAASIEFEQ